MFLVSTRNFPPEIGGMQNLMEGLSNALLNHGPVKVFAEEFDESKDYDQNSKLNIERVSGFKIFRKYRKANLVKEFINSNKICLIIGPEGGFSEDEIQLAKDNEITEISFGKSRLRSETAAIYGLSILRSITS